MYAMGSEEAVRISGAPGSPYTRKMLAVLRYRRIAYRFIMRNTPEDAATPTPRIPVIPILVLPGEDQARVDSTPLIRELDVRYTSRQLLPTDPALALLDALLEDFADEWMTKAMFHYRWQYPPDAERAGCILPRWGAITKPAPELKELQRLFTERQTGRLWVVGSNETTGPIIEASYQRLLGILDALLTGRRFLLGDRPGAGDFAFYGQLTQLALFDPTPMALTLQVAPRIFAWTQLVDDLSGLEVPSWQEVPAPADAMKLLLQEIGRVYAPYLLANLAALESGAEQVQATIDGAPWVQKTFPYHGKCLTALRQQYAGLKEPDRCRFDEWIQGSGCELLFARP